MRIAILGGGFTGMTAAYRLIQKGHEVYLFEKEGTLGGLAVGFSNPKWRWTLERAYHHWFTNDYFALKLAKEINQKVIIKKPKTDIFIDNKFLSFDSPISLLTFPYLSLTERIRTAIVLSFLKLIPSFKLLKKQKALPWIRKWFGKKTTQIIWNPLFSGKFQKYKNQISLTWFWARIKKRTQKLAYPEKGFKAFAQKLGEKIKKNGGKILLNTSVEALTSNKNDCQIKVNGQVYNFDRVIVTLPSPIFTKITKNLPQLYIKRVNSIQHLHALVLVLVFKENFMKNTYWLNISNKDYPFLVLVEHTNFMNPKYYADQHILYIGNYLPMNHEFLKLSKEELLKIFDPYLKKVNPNYSSSLIDSHLFMGPFAQPIMTTNYSKIIPTIQTPLKNIYLANMDMIYPWDRGTNYAIELGEAAANQIF